MDDETPTLTVSLNLNYFRGTWPANTDTLLKKALECQEFGARAHRTCPLHTDSSSGLHSLFSDTYHVLALDKINELK